MIDLGQQNTHLKQTEEKRSRTTQIFSFQGVNHTLVSMLSRTLSHTNIEKDMLMCIGMLLLFLLSSSLMHRVRKVTSEMYGVTDI